MLQFKHAFKDLFVKEYFWKFPNEIPIKTMIQIFYEDSPLHHQEHSSVHLVIMVNPWNLPYFKHIFYDRFILPYHTS